jgi:hypothetical protein
MAVDTYLINNTRFFMPHTHWPETLIVTQNDMYNPTRVGKSTKGKLYTLTLILEFI